MIKTIIRWTTIGLIAYAVLCETGIVTGLFALYVFIELEAIGKLFKRTLR